MSSTEPEAEAPGADGDGAAAGQTEAEGGEVIGSDAAAAEAGSDGLEALLHAAPPASVEQVSKCSRERGASPPKLPPGFVNLGTTDPHQARPPVKSFPPAKIRNVALVGHGGAGKTTLTEALLCCAGAITRQGRVEDGSTTTDFDPEEVKRGISVSLALAPFEYEGHKINLLDCPGYADFIADVDAALRVADLAVFVVSAVEGVEVQTEAVWRMAERARRCPA